MVSALKACITSDAAASAMKLRWLSNAPFGFPVVPDVLSSSSSSSLLLLLVVVVVVVAVVDFVHR